ECDRADSPLGEKLRDALPAPRCLELLSALLGLEIFIRHQREAFLERKLLGSGSHQEHMPRFLHDATCEIDRISDVAYAGNRTSPLTFAIHDRGIQFGCTIMGQSRSTPRIEERVI